MTRRATLHLPAVPHTITRPDFSHCAFTGKVLRFPKMMMAQGFDVIHYGVAGSETGATLQVDLMDEAEQVALLGHPHHADVQGFIGTDANAESALYKQFNHYLRAELKARVEPGDIICAAFGKAHEQALRGLPILDAARAERAWGVETGIGYPDVFLPYRIYESEAWRHYHLGHPRRGGQGSNWEWVIPNYFDVDEWTLGDGTGDGKGPFVLYFGRINDNKGLLVVTELARRRPDLRFVLCGQGDPTFYLQQSPNLEYLPPLSGRARSALLGQALCVLMPSRYVEPFGGVTIEAHLCGTPVLGSVYGSFTETIQPGVNGFRCRTLGDWLAALELVEQWQAVGSPMDDRPGIQQGAREVYGLEPCGQEYAEVFDTIATLSGDGYLAHVSKLGPITKAVVPPVAEVVPFEAGNPRPTGTAVSENEWKIAQQFERRWWLGNPAQWAKEQEKQEFYAAKMGFPLCTDADLITRGAKYDFAGARVLDIGCGPFSLMLRSNLGDGVAVDPIDYGPDLEAAYVARGLVRIIGPAERLAVGDGPFDEGWCYNCLQHVMDPALILEKLKAHCTRIRLYEWLNLPPHEGHPHELRETLFDAAFPEAEWRRDTWEVGETVTPLLYGRYLAAVVTRR